MDKVSPSCGTLTSAVKTPAQLEAYTEHRRCIDSLDSSAEAFRQAMKRTMEAITSSKSEFQHVFFQEAEEEIADTLAERRWISQWLKHVTGRFSNTDRLTLRPRDPTEHITEYLSSLSLSEDVGSNEILNIPEDIRLLEARSANVNQRHREANIGHRDLWESLNNVMDELIKGREC
jgi:hypothetical protein